MSQPIRTAKPSAGIAFGALIDHIKERDIDTVVEEIATAYLRSRGRVPLSLRGTPEESTLEGLRQKDREHQEIIAELHGMLEDEKAQNAERGQLIAEQKQTIDGLENHLREANAAHARANATATRAERELREATELLRSFQSIRDLSARVVTWLEGR